MRVNLFDPGPVATRMRAKAFPGEDRATLPQPDAVAPALAALCLPSRDAQRRPRAFRRTSLKLVVLADHHDGIPGCGRCERQDEAADQKAKPQPAAIGVKHQALQRRVRGHQRHSGHHPGDTAGNKMGKNIRRSSIVM